MNHLQYRTIVESDVNYLELRTREKRQASLTKGLTAKTLLEQIYRQTICQRFHKIDL